MQDSTASPASDRLFATLVGLGYLLGGLLWIGFSDQAGKLLFSSPGALTRFQTWKGAGFVLASALLVFLLASRASRHGALRPGVRTQVRLSALLLGLVLVTAVPLATMLGYNVWRQARANAQETETLAHGFAQATAARTLAYLEDRQQLARRLGERRGAGGQAAPGGSCGPMLAEVAALFDDIVDVLVLDADGRTVCAAEGAAGVPVTAVQLQGQGVLLSPARGEPVVALTSAIGAGAPPIAGSMQLLLAQSRLHKMAAGSAASGVSIALLTTDGRVLALAPPQPHAGATDSDPGSALLAEAARAGRTSVMTLGADGRDRFHAVRMVPGTNLLVAAGLHVDEAFQAAREQALRSLAVVAIGVLLAALLLATILRRISVPMTALARTAEAVAGGDLARRAPEAGPLEVARVAVEFNRMLDRLPALEQAVLESEERHRTLLQKLSRNIPGTLFQLCLAPDGRLWMPFASEAIEVMFEVTQQQANADANSALRRIHPDDLPVIEEALHGPDRSLTSRVLRYRVLLSARGQRHYLTYAQPEPQADGAVLWHGCTVDVTSQEEARLALRQANETLEARVEERTRALAAANESLESFSYSVAHDLRAPLAAIEGFTGALSAVLERGDRERLARLSDRIAANTRQMGAMIDGLLDIARAGKGELQEAEVPLQKMVAGVLAEVAPPASMEVEVGPLPVVRADPATLRQVWWNLLANAAKFTAHRARGRIEVSCGEQGGELVFMVRDNGAGFDPQYAGRLFTAFQRLHDAREFEGTGIGLALVRRVVERHGGRIWAEGRPEQGACFCFTLPASRLVRPA